MAEPKSSAPVGAIRRGLTIGGVALAVINIGLMVSGTAGGSGPMLGAVLWGAAAVCFLGAFVAYMMEPVAKLEGKGPASPSPAAPAAAAEASAPGTPPDPEKIAEKEPDSGRGGHTPLLRRGNPLRWTRGGITALLGTIFTMLLMAKQGQWRWGVPLGAVFTLIASWGVMDLMGTFDDPDDRLERSTRLGDLASPLGGFLVTGLVFCFALGGAQAGIVLPQIAWGILVTLAFVAWTAAFFALGRKLGPLALDENGEERPLLKRHGFWVVTLSAALLFPVMGIYSLWDPWETHYGGVPREMLSRDDWISLWWAQDGWFWSKPVADMWMQAVSMATLGVHYQPDKMLIGDGTKPVMHPEWAVRAPVVLLTIVALYLLYKGVSKTFGRRAAFLGCLVLST